MRLPKKVAQHCREEGITYVWENDEYVEFAAPRGYVFGNQSRWRIIHVEDVTTDILGLFKQRG